MQKMSLTFKIQWLFLCVVPLLILSFNTHLSKGSDDTNTIYAGQFLSGNQTITSQSGVFEPGFFTPGNSQNYYIGIWYKKLPNKTVVWVANRVQPISNLSSSQLKLSQDGNLVLLDQSKNQIWSTNSISKLANSTIAMLLDNGNFIVRDKLDSSNVIWQSFDYPTDTWLPGGKVGYNKLKNEKQALTSWRNSENPSPSLFSLEVEPNSSHILLWNVSNLYWTSGIWSGKLFSLVPEIELDYYIKNVTYVNNTNESYFTYDAGDPTALTRFVLDVTGQLKQFVWGKDFPQWSTFWIKPPQQCTVYAFCGVFSSCNQNVPICTCIEGFDPRTQADWELGDHSGGCVRKIPLQCENRGNDKFSVVPNTGFPVNSELITVENIDECELACLGNCSCSAYAYDNRCLIWGGGLFNLRQLSSDDKSGRDLHVRVAASQLVGNEAKAKAKAKAKRNTSLIVFGAICGFFCFFGSVLVVLWRKRQRDTAGTLEKVDDSLAVFKYRDIRIATKNFSEKLGEGGFGTVFKGTLPNSIAVAVKTLKSLKQGEKQFRAEVSTIGMIQHINLVRLRGFCIQGTKRFLVYDYMSNGSLESHLFKKDNINVLDWKTRYNISVGTARGLTYLHEKCRDCIIHCDIKPENILLDAEYNPKVADFGLAKLVGREISRVLTTTRGTRGYLAPEWISGEAITPKADVFSYGMLLFEIISGRRNSDIVDDEMDWYFPFLVVTKMKESEESVMSFLDYRLQGNGDVEEVIRACKVACWCIQDDEKDRPSMGQVVQILEGILEVGMPPIPHFLQGLADDPLEPRSFFEDGSTLLS